MPLALCQRSNSRRHSVLAQVCSAVQFSCCCGCCFRICMFRVTVCVDAPHALCVWSHKRILPCYNCSTYQQAWCTCTTPSCMCYSCIAVQLLLWVLVVCCKCRSQQAASQLHSKRLECALVLVWHVCETLRSVWLCRNNNRQVTMLCAIKMHACHPIGVTHHT